MAKNEKINLYIGARDQTRSVLNNIKGQILAVGGAYLSWRAVSGIVKGIIDAGIESEKVYNDLAASIKRHGESWDILRDHVREFTDTLQTATGVSDELVATGMQRLIDYGMTTAEAMKYMALSTDLSVGSNIDLMAATDLVGKSFVGYTGTLSRYGIIIDQNLPKSQQFAAAIQQMNDRFGGAAAARMNTTAGQIALIGQKWEDLKENIFKSSEAGKYMTAAIAGVIPWLDNISNVLKSGITALSAWHDVFTTTFKNAGIEIEAFVRLFKASMDFDLPAMAGYSAIFFDKVENGIDNVTDAFERAKMKTALYAMSLASTLGLSQKAMQDILNTYGEMFDNAQDNINDLGLATVEVSNEMNENLKNLINNWMEHDQEVMRRDFEEWQSLQQAKFDEAQQFQNDITSITSSAIDTIVDQLWAGELQMRTIFSQMAKDFTKYFIQRALQELAAKFVFGLLGILGSIFDTRKNDMMMAQQGADAAKYFTQGMTDYMNSTNLAGRLAMPAGGMMAGASGGGGGTVIQQSFYFQGMSDEQYIRRKVIPVIEEAAASGRSNISVNNNNITEKFNARLS